MSATSPAAAASTTYVTPSDFRTDAMRRKHSEASMSRKWAMDALLFGDIATTMMSLLSLSLTLLLLSILSNSLR